MPSCQSLVAVTGASGFVGRYLAPWLVERGYGVRGTTRGDWSPRLASLEISKLGDRPSAAQLRSAFDGAEAVVHLAGRAHVMRDTAADPAAAYRAANVELTRAALLAAKEAGCGLFVLASSVKAVGERSDTPWTEDTPPRPVDLYGESKLEAEQLVTAEGKWLGLRTVILRFPLIYGPGMRANMLRLFRAVDRGLPMPLRAIHNRRSLLYLGNAAAAVERALRSGPEGAGLYFVSDGEDLSTSDLVRAVATALGRKARLFPFPDLAFRLAGRLGSALAPWCSTPVTSSAVERLLGSLEVDITQVRSRLGYLPPFTVAEGLRITAAWYRSHNEETA